MIFSFIIIVNNFQVLKNLIRWFWRAAGQANSKFGPFFQKSKISSKPSPNCWKGNKNISFTKAMTFKLKNVSTKFEILSTLVMGGSLHSNSDERSLNASTVLFFVVLVESNSPLCGLSLSPSNRKYSTLWKGYISCKWSREYAGQDVLVTKWVTLHQISFSFLMTYVSIEFL